MCKCNSRNVDYASVKAKHRMKFKKQTYISESVPKMIFMCYVCASALSPCLCFIKLSRIYCDLSFTFFNFHFLFLVLASYFYIYWFGNTDPRTLFKLKSYVLYFSFHPFSLHLSLSYSCWHCPSPTPLPSSAVSDTGVY